MSLKPKSDMVLAEVSEGVLAITLNRPSALNALRPEMLEDVRDLVTAAQHDDEVSVVTIEGAGRSFSAGVDLKVLQGIEPQAGKIGDLFDAPARQAYLAIRHSRLPVIAKVHGACFTGALELALHCDFILTTVDAKFGDTHAKFGLRPTWGMSQTLAQAVGIRRAKELSFSARVFRGSEAVALGIANRASDSKDDLDDQTRKLTAQIVENSREAVAAIKDLYACAQLGLGLEEGLKAELEREYPLIADTNQRLAGF